MKETLEQGVQTPPSTFSSWLWGPLPFLWSSFLVIKAVNLLETLFLISNLCTIYKYTRLHQAVYMFMSSKLSNPASLALLSISQAVTTQWYGAAGFRGQPEAGWHCKHFATPHDKLSTGYCWNPISLEFTKRFFWLDKLEWGYFVFY